ncbi:MAG: LysR family transcriptional regulator [Sandaracinaceae bacterium]
MKLSPIDLNLLVALDAILTTGSVRLAAERVGLSKPAMSHALRRLRGQLGDEVLVRTGQEWVLTDRARALAPRVRALVDEAHGVLRAAGDVDAASVERQFRIHATDHVLSILGVALGHAIGVEAPHVNLCFLPIQPDDASALRAADVDLAIGVFPGLPGELRTQRLFRDRFVCVIRRARAPRELTLERYLALKHVLVSPRGRPGSVVDDALAAIGHRRRVARSVPYFLSALDVVSKSEGCIATISERLATMHAERFGLRVLAPPLPLPDYDIHQVWHPRVDSDPEHRWLRRKVARAAKDSAP